MQVPTAVMVTSENVFPVDETLAYQTLVCPASIPPAIPLGSIDRPEAVRVCTCVNPFIDHRTLENRRKEPE